MSALQTALSLSRAAGEPSIEARPPSRPILPVLLGVLTAVSVGVGVGLGYEQYVLVGVLAVALGLLSFLVQRGLLYVLVLVPFGESLGLGSMTVGRLMAVLCVVVLLARFLTGRLPVPAFRPVTWLPAAAYVLLVVASGLWATDHGGWLFAIGQVLLALAFFAAFALLIDHPRQVGGLLRVYVVGALLAAGVGFLQSLTDARAVGLQGDANIYALYQVAALPAALALARTTTGARRACWLVVTVPILASVLFSQSRGALLALVATATFLALLDRRRRLLVPLVAGVGLLATVVVPLLDDRYSVERVSADRASGRIDIWYTAWHAFLEQPWTGIGAGNYVPQSIERLTTEPGVELIKSHLLTGQGIEVHNIYLEALAERGVFGLLTLAVLLVCTLGCLLVVAHRTRSLLVQALAPMLVAYCVASFFLSVSNSKLLWMLVGLAAALLVHVQTPSPASRPEPVVRSIR
ncbi:O-antigen ligase family protein [Geodermatophilus ruber]|uniref:O-antigen ligase n=1 Tax=Geodermatophilus ruber TaxID=504800 RepID=A0A1I4DG52_9ACTN|nr:O-antigen ligase family protein [Geodermatophilus ruber]SFK92185.1 O-antigen ligase [Geodermatophilus ruber]